MRDLYYKSSEGFVMVYSITDTSSLEDVKDRYQSLLDATVMTHFISEGENELLQERKLRELCVS